MADPQTADPAARKSTRLTAAMVSAAQTLLDPEQLKAWIPNSGYGGHDFGYGSFNAFLANREKNLPWIAEYSPSALATPDDPPVYLRYKLAPAARFLSGPDCGFGDHGGTSVVWMV